MSSSYSKFLNLIYSGGGGDGEQRKCPSKLFCNGLSGIVNSNTDEPRSNPPWSIHSSHLENIDAFRQLIRKDKHYREIGSLGISDLY